MPNVPGEPVLLLHVKQHNLAILFISYLTKCQGFKDNFHSPYVFETYHLNELILDEKKFLNIIFLKYFAL